MREVEVEDQLVFANKQLKFSGEKFEIAKT